MSTERYHCDRCGWDGETPALRDWVGGGCGGVVWTLRVCPACGDEVHETVIPEGLRPWPVEGERHTPESGMDDPC